VMIAIVQTLFARAFRALRWRAGSASCQIPRL
jgi:hypothetical protein